MNKWEAVIEYMNNNVGTIGSRQGLISHVQANTEFETWNNHNEYIQVVKARQDRRDRQSFTTIDCYKNYLIQAGLIHKVRANGKTLQGRFFIPEKINQFITIKEVRKKAYGPKLMMIGTDRASKSMCMSAGHYYIGGSGDSDYMIYKDTTNTISEPKEPDFLSEDDMKL